MPEFSGKGLARRRQREQLEAVGFQMVNVTGQRLADEPFTEHYRIVATVSANKQDIELEREVHAKDVAELVRMENQLRAEAARRYAECVMGPPSDIELASFPGSDAPGGSPGGARQAPLPGQHRDDDDGATRDQESRVAPAWVHFTETDDGVSFTITFGGDEYDPSNNAHRTALAVVGMLEKLGPLERIKLAGPDLHEEVEL